MPEGPSLLILKEKLKPFEGKKVLAASGAARIDLARLTGQKIMSIKTWGKHLLICFKGFFVRIHLLMFGTYRINERREGALRLRLSFESGELNFYACHVVLLEGSPDPLYDWQADVMGDDWDAAKALAKLKALKNVLVCDALLNQNIFSGVGNIIKNEALFLAKIHPRSLVEKIPTKKLKELIQCTFTYTWNFYEWKKQGVLSRNFQVYDRKICPRCKILLNTGLLGKTKRLSYFCANCEELYT